MAEKEIPAKGDAEEGGWDRGVDGAGAEAEAETDAGDAAPSLDCGADADAGCCGCARMSCDSSRPRRMLCCVGLLA